MENQKFDFNFAKEEVFQNAKEHGWWDSDRPAKEAIALMHSELSEALEEYRNARPMLWYESEESKKPEGIGVELIDCVIRVLDFMGRYNLWFYDDQPRENEEDESLPELVADLHHDLSEVLDTAWICDPIETTEISEAEDCDHEQVASIFSQVVMDIFGWIEDQGCDPYELMKLKNDYNKTRPYRHGGKVC